MSSEKNELDEKSLDDLIEDVQAISKRLIDSQNFPTLASKTERDGYHLVPKTEYLFVADFAETQRSLIRDKNYVQACSNFANYFQAHQQSLIGFQKNVETLGLLIRQIIFVVQPRKKSEIEMLKASIEKLEKQIKAKKASEAKEMKKQKSETKKKDPADLEVTGDLEEEHKDEQPEELEEYEKEVLEELDDEPEEEPEEEDEVDEIDPEGAWPGEEEEQESEEEND